MHYASKVRFVLSIIFVLFSASVSFAQTVYVNSGQKRIVDVEVHFRWDKHDLDMEYMGNDASMARFARIIEHIGPEYIDSVVIVSQSSPEGPYKYNVRLSERRAATMRGYVLENFPVLSGKLHVHPDGESWEQLRWYVECDTVLDEAAKKRILAVIDDDVNIETKKWRMGRLPTYNYLLRTYYPRIRNSMFCILYFSKDAMPQFPSPQALELPDSLPCIPVTPYPAPLYRRNSRMVAALKTNFCTMC